MPPYSGIDPRRRHDGHFVEQLSEERAAALNASTITMPLVPSEDERTLRDSVRGICSRFGPEYFDRITREGGQLTQLWNELARAGYVGLHLPEQYGGGGAGVSELAMVLEEAAACGCPPRAFIYSAGMAGPLILKHARADVRDEWLPRLASGESIVSFALTESDAGSNSYNIRTTAVYDESDETFVVNGEKQFITGVESASAIVVAARTQVDEAGKSARMSLFLLDTTTAGLSRKVIPTAIQMPERSWTLNFDDVRVPAGRLIGELHHGMRAIFDGLNSERVLVAAIACGFARYALSKAVDYARTREVWGVPIGSHQGVAHPLAEAKIELEAARLMTRKAALMVDAGLEAGECSNISKMLAANAAIHALDRAIHTHGGNGVADEYHLARYWFDVRLFKVAPVSEELILSYVAHNVLGLPKSY